KMRSLMGVSPADFMRRTRLSHAAKLRTDTRLAGKEIAFDCGFADLNYFGKCFKAAYGTTPTGYRRGS
ncbi:MAG: helix-turn-helix domain-containing protein, partial [Duncaniella sp.]|nr:helix-turn-helix domain-containing protein [Duncaniella sp.]